jgi:hypothetical protein
MQGLSTLNQAICDEDARDADWRTGSSAGDTRSPRSGGNRLESDAYLIRNLVDIASKGGGYLLNIAPVAGGIIENADLGQAAAIAAWMRINGESIHGVIPGPFRRLGFDGRCTQRFNTVYVHVFNWSDSYVTLPGLATTALYAENLPDGERVSITPTEQGIRIGRPRRVDPIDTVIRVRLTSEVALSGYALPISVDPARGAILEPVDARIQDTAVRVTGGEPNPVLAWADSRGSASWPVRFARPGRYLVYLGCANGSSLGPAAFRLSCGNNTIEGRLLQTDSWNDYKNTVAGTIEVSSEGDDVLTIAPRHAACNRRFPNIRSIGLVPIASESPAPHGTVFLGADSACLVGSTVRLESISNRSNVGFWTDPDDYLVWEVALPEMRAYDAWIEAACTNEDAGSTYTLGTPTSFLTAKVVGTGGWSNFQAHHAGRVTLGPGKAIVAVKPVVKMGFAVMNYRKIILRPVSN